MVKLAVGGLLFIVIVLVTIVPGPKPGMMAAFRSTNLRSDNDIVVVPDLIISNATLAKRTLVLMNTAPFGAR